MSATAFQRMRREQAVREALEKKIEEEEKPIDKMTVVELKEYAEKNAIDLGKASKRTDIIAVIHAAIAEKQAQIKQLEQEKQLQELRGKAISLGIEDVENKDIETLANEISILESKGGEDDASK